MDGGFYIFPRELKACADRRLNNATIRRLWQGFCCQAGQIVMEEADGVFFRTGAIPVPEVPGNAEFVIRVTEQGMAVAAKDYSGLARGVLVLMMRIEPVALEEGREQFRVAACSVEGNYGIRSRMIHFCVFPETTPTFLQKCIRLAGVMQYTHVVLEFWGMLRYDCLKELAWGNAWPKDFAKGIVREIEDMGMEAVPMMNHLGHAAGCRVSGGKHVVLDQNPRLAALFSPDGWSWNILNPRARDLLKDVRRELYEVFPNARYFHLGCDEVYSYEKGDEDQRRMRSFLRSVIEEVQMEGVRPIIWGDMLLNARACGVDGGHQPYVCGCDTPEHADKLIAAIPRDTVIADWHYDILQAPVKTSVYLKEKGFDVLGAPWFEDANCRAHADTAREHGLMGVMVTTWHTLAQKMPHIVADALMCGAFQSPWSGPESSKVRTETAALLRKVCFVDGDYKEAGWTDSQIFMQANPMT